MNSKFWNQKKSQSFLVQTFTNVLSAWKFSAQNNNCGTCGQKKSALQMLSKITFLQHRFCYFFLFATTSIDVLFEWNLASTKTFTKFTKKFWAQEILRRKEIILLPLYQNISRFLIQREYKNTSYILIFVGVLIFWLRGSIFFWRKKWRVRKGPRPPKKWGPRGSH